MPTLEKSLRNQFERTVKSAREAAEAAARGAIAHLGVGDAGPPDHLSEAQKDLRRRLRIHGRQIGDRRNLDDKTQEIDLLVEEFEKGFDRPVEDHGGQAAAQPHHHPHEDQQDLVVQPGLLVPRRSGHPQRPGGGRKKKIKVENETGEFNGI